MSMWRKDHDPFITIIPVQSSSFLPLVFDPPDSECTIHVGVYLPTAGQDAEFIGELAELDSLLIDMHNKYPGSSIYLRGDFNVSATNDKRTNLLNSFCTDHDLDSVHIGHKTYHHFVGEGSSDSNLDHIYYSKGSVYPERLTKIYCKQVHPLVNSHHDILLSSITIPQRPPIKPDDAKNIIAPVVKTKRLKVKWSEEGINQYKVDVTPKLQLIQEVYLNSSKPSPSVLSLCLQSTTRALVESACATNKFLELGTPSTSKTPLAPYYIRKSQKQLIISQRHLSKFKGSQVELEALRKKHKSEKTKHRLLLRKQNAKDSIMRDSPLFSILESGNTNIFRSIRGSKKGVTRKITKLSVNGRTYSDESVHNGFYDSLLGLKTLNMGSIQDPASFDRYQADFENILKLCSSGPDIPEITLDKAANILMRIRRSVNDLYSTSSSHFIFAGDIGILHFYNLLKALIDDVRNTTIEEVNTVHAVILFKGHRKDKTLASSYRTISTCPVVAKGLDIYLRDLNLDLWNDDQATTQFLGEGSSHELAALMLTEVSQYSLCVLHQPLFILYLDAKSAFDKVLGQLLIRNLYFCGTTGKELLHINNRLQNRKTVAEWDRVLMGPIIDQQGVEQGGVNSGDFYKIYSKRQLQMAQNSLLGVPLSRNIVISAIGQADGTTLVSIILHSLQNLLELSQHYCTKNSVQLCSEKTVLQALFTKDMAKEVEYLKKFSPVDIDGVKVKFKNNAEHVGIVRSVHGNLPNVVDRISSHKAAIGAVLAHGLANHHRANQAARLRVEQIYGTPVLLSGLASLILKKSEQTAISTYHRKTLSRLIGLKPFTPHPVIYFLAGSLPGEALLHLRQLSLLGMVSRLRDSLIHRHALNVFNSEKTWSWFHQVRDLCLMYQLPHPLITLNTPDTKEAYKKKVKQHVLNYWEKKLRMMSENLISLKFFKPSYMSLAKPHPLLTTAGPSPYEVTKARVQVLFLSGRYRTELLCSKWSPNTGGFCQTPMCLGKHISEDIEHILLKCRSLDKVRERLVKFTLNYSLSVPFLSDILLTMTQPTHTQFLKFLLDCSAIPEVIFRKQVLGDIVLHHLFKVSRTWCYSLHRERLKLLGRWIVP